MLYFVEFLFNYRFLQMKPIVSYQLINDFKSADFFANLKSNFKIVQLFLQI